MGERLTHWTDEELVERVPTDNPGDRIWQQAPYVLEMERRLLVAMRDFKQEAHRQGTIMIWLTVMLTLFTVAIVWLTAVLVLNEGGAS
jgi:hypothetical protein